MTDALLAGSGTGVCEADSSRQVHPLLRVCACHQGYRWRACVAGERGKQEVCVPLRRQQAAVRAAKGGKTSSGVCVRDKPQHNMADIPAGQRWRDGGWGGSHVSKSNEPVCPHQSQWEDWCPTGPSGGRSGTRLPTLSRHFGFHSRPPTALFISRRGHRGPADGRPGNRAKRFGAEEAGVPPESGISVRAPLIPH